MAPSLRRNIGLLIEGHVQYQFMTIQQIENSIRLFTPNNGKGSLLRINEQTESGAETAYFENVLRTTLAGSFRTNPGAESGTTGTG